MDGRLVLIHFVAQPRLWRCEQRREQRCAQ